MCLFYSSFLTAVGNTTICPKEFYTTTVDQSVIFNCTFEPGPPPQWCLSSVDNPSYNETPYTINITGLTSTLTVHISDLYPGLFSVVCKTTEGLLHNATLGIQGRTLLSIFDAGI